MKGNFSQKLVLMSAVLTMAVGYLVLFGWWINSNIIIQIAPDLPKMQYNAALMLLLSGAGILLARKYRWLTFGVGVFVVALSSLTLAQYITGIDFGINQLFVLPHMEHQQIIAGPVAPNSALCFLFAGLAMVLMSGILDFVYLPTVISILGLIIFVFSAVALLGYYANLPTTYSWSNLSRMALHGSITLMILSIGIIAHSWRAGLTEGINLTVFLPFVVVMAGVIFFVLLWQAMLANENHDMRNLIDRESVNILHQVSFLLNKVPSNVINMKDSPQKAALLRQHLLSLLHSREEIGFVSELKVNSLIVYKPEKYNKGIVDQFSVVTNLKYNEMLLSLKVWPTQTLINAEKTPYPTVTLVTGLIISSLLGLLLHFWQVVKQRELVLSAEIEQRRHAEEELQEVAYYDFLTGLPNRFLFEKDLELALARSKRHGRILGICLIDLDEFQEINDGLGHEVGDELIKVIAHRFAKSVREADVLARFSGDMFAVLIDEMTSRRDADLVAHRLLEALATAISVRSNQINVNASIGVAAYPESGDSVNTLIKNADIALQRAQKAGGNDYQYFTPRRKDQNEYLYKIESGLHSALRKDQLSLFYQPIFNYTTNQVESLEVLLRWKHPELGWISPEDFVPIAEELGLILPIGDWVLKNACKQYAIWRDVGLTYFRVSVNLSVPQLMQADLSEKVRDILKNRNIEANRLQFEITETSVMHYFKKADIILKTMRDMGIEILLDDFGTGYSSLAYLHRLPISGLKIDKWFIRNIATEESAAKIANSIIQLAHSFDIKVIAEGVEDEIQLKFLREHGCILGQGHYFSKPLDTEEMTMYLHKNKV